MKKKVLERPLRFGLPRRIRLLLAIVAGAVLLPCVTLFWNHQQRDKRFHAVSEWHTETQGASQDAMLSLDELIWERRPRDRSGQIDGQKWTQDDSTLFNRVRYYIGRIPKHADYSKRDGIDVIRKRLTRMLTKGEEMASKPPAQISDQLLTLRATLNQLRLLHSQEYEELRLDHQQAKRRSLAILLPITAGMVIAGLIVCGYILRDIRLQIARERELVESLTASEARYRNLVEHLPHGIEEFDREGVITYSNPAHHQMLGYPEGELIGRSVSALLADPVGRRQFASRLRTLLRGEEPTPRRFTSRNLTKTGEEISVWVDWEYQRGPDGQVTGFVAIVTNITEREAAERALVESEEKFRALVESSRDWIWEINLDGEHTYSNNEVAKILGYSAREIADFNISTLFHPADYAEVQDRLPELIASGAGWENWVVRMQHKDGGYRHLESSARPILDERGTVVGYRGIDRDITARIRNADRLRASLREKETLLHEVHHRVKNNLQVISSLLHFQQKKAEGGRELELLGEAKSRLQAMTLLHDKLYRSESLDEIEMAGYIRDLANQIRAPYQNSARPVALRVETEPVRLRLDQALPVGMIVTELMTNAMKHAFPNGSECEIGVSLGVDENRVSIVITDNGIGLPVSVDPDGSSTFGLSLVKNLARQVGGSVSYRRGTGTTATLEFPLGISEPEPDRLSGPDSEQSLASITDS